LFVSCGFRRMTASPGFISIPEQCHPHPVDLSRPAICLLFLNCQPLPDAMTTSPAEAVISTRKELEYSTPRLRWGWPPPEW
jgi:hypothetical protein